MELLKHWGAQALVIAITTSIILNSALFIPYLKTRKIKRIDARLVGFGGTTAAFFLWCVLNPQWPAWPHAFGVCAAIVAATLGPNWLIHKCRGDPDDNVKIKVIEIRKDNPGGDTRIVEISQTDTGRALLEELLSQRAPGDKKGTLDWLFKAEQRQETALERWENAMYPALDLPGLLDEVTSCIVMALVEGRAAWLLTALDDIQEARKSLCKTRWNLLLWCRLFWPQYVR